MKASNPFPALLRAFFQEWLKDVQIDSKVTSFESSKLTNIILDGEFDIFQWGWYVEPDPDSMLSYFTCDQRGNWSDSWYCNPEYDKLYLKQNAELDDAKRQEIVQQMLTILYEDAPYLNTTYDTIGEAYRSDRWEGFVPQPNPGGILLFQYGHANYLNVAPAGTASGTPGQAQEDDAGSGQVMLIVLVIALAGAAVVGGWLFMRRRTADDRE